MRIIAIREKGTKGIKRASKEAIKTKKNGITKVFLFCVQT
jgi:hypothetical protein